MKQIIKKYLLSLQYEKGVSSKTIESYSIDLNKYAEYLKFKYNISNPNQIYMKHIKSFLSEYLRFYNSKDTPFLTLWIMCTYFSLKIFVTFKKVKPDLILNFTIKPVIYSSIASSFLNIPKALTKFSECG